MKNVQEYTTFIVIIIITIYIYFIYAFLYLLYIWLLYVFIYATEEIIYTDDFYICINSNKNYIYISIVIKAYQNYYNIVIIL